MKVEPIDWSRIRLVAFDVDGTLYAQRPVRLHMAARLLLHCFRHADATTLAVLRTYRVQRESVGDAEVVGFDETLVSAVAHRHGLSCDVVRCIATEWIEQRPLRLVGQFRYPSVDRLFQRLQRSGRTIGVLSDYPAEAKLAAMGLEAEHVVCAGDVGVLKPHPGGLERLMAFAEVDTSETLLIGDRAERDGEVARRAGVACMLRSKRPLAGYLTFSRFDDPVFDGIDGTALPLHA